jgi:hypothetical protein
MTTTSAAAATGLDQAAVRERVRAGQVNKAPPEPGRTVAQILRANVFTRFNAILGTLFAVVLSRRVVTTIRAFNPPTALHPVRDFLAAAT